MTRANSLLTLACLLAIGAGTLCETSTAQTCPQHAPCLNTRLLPPGDGVAGSFGASIDQDGDFAVVGRPGDPENGFGAGAAVVYRYDPVTGWIEEQKLTADDGDSQDAFGASVAISGAFVMAGARGNDEAADNAGAVYVFERQDATWVQVQKITPSGAAAFDLFGTVALDGDVAVMGATQFSAAGFAHVYRYDGEVWVWERALEHEPGTTNFGSRVAIADDVIVVGDNAYDGFRGAAFAYRHGAEGWTFEQRLDGTGGQFSIGLAAGGNPPRIISGAWGANATDPLGAPRGAAYIYRANGIDGEDPWLLERTILGEPGLGALFGFAVDIDDDPVWRAVVTRYRWDATEFRLTDEGEWCEVRRWTPPEGDEYDLAGFAAALDGDRVLLGASGAEVGIPGVVYAWNLDDGCACPADLDGSGAVDFTDLVSILAAWGPCPGCPADLDGSGAVDFTDLVTMLAAWGPCS